MDDINLLRKQYEKLRTEEAVAGERYEEAAEDLERKFDIKVDDVDMEELEKKVLKEVDGLEKRLDKLREEITERLSEYEYD